MKFCSECGEPTDQNAKFCGACGTALVVESLSGDDRSNLDDRPVSSSSGDLRTAAPRRAQPPCLIVIPEGSHPDLLVAVRHARPRDEVLRVRAEESLTRVQETLDIRRRSGRDTGGVCLIGDRDAIPMITIEDRTGMDEAVLTDNPYGSTLKFDALQPSTWIPEIPVGRIPFSDIALIDRLLQVGADLPASWEATCAVSASVWRNASRAVLNSVEASSVSLITSPEADSSQLAAELGDPMGRLYFNVHGSNLESDWYGEGVEGDYPVVLTPSTLKYQANAIMISEACYGATQIFGSDGVLQRFLQAGGSCFIGSTIIAWGPSDEPIGEADIIAAHSYRQLDAGLSAGQALVRAKLEVINSALERSTRISPVEMNTVLSFALMGPPWACVTQRPDYRQGSVLNRIRDRLAGVEEEDISLLGRIRTRIAERYGVSEDSSEPKQRLNRESLLREFERPSEVASILGVNDPSFQYAVRASMGGHDDTLAFVAARHRREKFPLIRGVIAKKTGEVTRSYQSK